MELEQLNGFWVVLFAGITACSPILVAIITKMWGRRVGRSDHNAESEQTRRFPLEHALASSISEHHHTQELLRDHNIEMRAHFDRLLRYVLPVNLPPEMARKVELLDDRVSRSETPPNTEPPTDHNNPQS